jgi:hypothetical protein
MDEIKMITALRPATPGDARQACERVRGRLEAAIAAAPARSPGRAISAHRSRRPVVLAGVAAAVAMGAAVVVPAVLPASRSGSFITPAWAIQRSADGTITVTINRALTHQAELQADLRADGVPAYVRSEARCNVWEPQGGFKQMRTDWRALLFPAPGNNDKNFSGIVIHPTAIPAGDAVFIGGSPMKYGLALQLFLMRGNHPPICAPSPHPRVGGHAPSGYVNVWLP